MYGSNECLQGNLQKVAQGMEDYDLVKLAKVGVARHPLVYGMVGNTAKLREQPGKPMVPRVT